MQRGKRMHGIHRGVAAGVLALTVGGCVAQRSAAAPQEGREVRGVQTWRQDPLFRQIHEQLREAWAIDNHTHLLSPVDDDAARRARMPLPGRRIEAAEREVLQERFGTTDAEEAGRIREERMRKDPAAYWTAHLDAVRIRTALVNDSDKPPEVNGRLKWVPLASHLLFPVPPSGFIRHPSAARFVARSEEVVAGARAR